MLPFDFNPMGCHAPQDELSSCAALLQSDIYRVFLSALSATILIGNMASFCYRVVFSPSKKTSFGIFVTSLCVSDFMMGVFLAIIGVADRVFLGSYVIQDSAWRASRFCHLAGFLSLISSEVSSLIICLITLDRFLAIRFPLKFHLHFTPRAAQITNAIAWFVGFCISTVPFLLGSDIHILYGKTGICAPLPITKGSHSYSFAVMIVLNFILFLLIGFGQVTFMISFLINRLDCHKDQSFMLYDNLY